MAGLTERLLNEGMQKGIQKGIQKGRREGRQEGRQEGAQHLLLRPLTRRFGPLDTATEQRLQQATLEEQERWSDNILDAGTLDEVFSTRG